MKLTARERILLGVLAIVGIIAISYYFVLKPQIEKIEQLTLEDIGLQQEVGSVKADLAVIENLNTEIKTILAGLEEKTKRFYPVILQDRFIILFDKLVTDNAVECSSITYSPPVPAPIAAPVQQPVQPYPLKDLAENYRSIGGNSKINESTVNSTEQNNGAVASQQNAPQTSQQQGPALVASSETMTVTLQVTGKYDQWMNFIKSIEALNRTVIIQNLVFAGGNTGSGTVNTAAGNPSAGAANAAAAAGIPGIGTGDIKEGIAGSIQLNIYAVPKLQDQDKEYMEWPLGSNPG